MSNDDIKQNMNMLSAIKHQEEAINKQTEETKRNGNPCSFEESDLTNTVKTNFSATR